MITSATTAPMIKVVELDPPEDVLLELVLDDVDVTVELVELEVVEEVGLLVVELVVCVPL